MPQSGQGTENNFTKGLITESTGLNFPENAATDCDNVTFTLIGDTTRRLGIDFEVNRVYNLLDRTNRAVSTYKWTNAGGDGDTQLLVVQNGYDVVFFNITAATPTSPVSAQRIPGSVSLNQFAPAGGAVDITAECTYADGNGYLFIFHPNTDPIYCTYSSGTVTGSSISVRVRDFYGIPEGAQDATIRPLTLTAQHNYNLLNQGWTSGSPWTAFSDFAVVGTLGSHTFNIGNVTGIVPGAVVSGSSAQQTGFGGRVIYPNGYMTWGGTVTSYSNPNITINITSGVNYSDPGNFQFFINPSNSGYINTWQTAEGNYPSNADVWWYFKNASGVFDPANTQPNVSLSAGNAPQGHYILNAFNLDRGSASGIAGLTPIETLIRPSVGCWFQGRVWYSGLAASQQPTGDAPFYTWSENIYFSQVNVGTAANFGNCFQVNDPTSENLFDILPTDGGVIQIQGSGRIYNLFPIQNGLLVFAANGVWFITGSQGIGFSATDYTITKISSITSFSSTSFVNVLGLPYFWNEEGIYQVAPQQGGSLSVESVTVGSIATFYDSIPTENKRYARGAYHPVDYTIQWIYRDELPNAVTQRYEYNRILNYNTYNKAWFPYTVDASLTNASINSIVYIQDTGLSDAIPSGFKYLASFLTGALFSTSLADEHDEDYVDWSSRTPEDYDSFFITGYRVRGKGMTKFQNQYVNVFTRTNSEPYGYALQGLWDYSNDRNSNRWSSKQAVIRNNSRYDVVPYRHKIRGHGLSLQLKVSSVSGMPFDIIGWSTVDTIEQGT